MSFAYAVIGGLLVCSTETRCGVFQAPAGVDVNEFLRSHDRIKYIHFPLKGKGAWKRVGSAEEALDHQEACWLRSHDQESPSSDSWIEMTDPSGYEVAVRHVREKYVCPYSKEEWYFEKTYW